MTRNEKDRRAAEEEERGEEGDDTDSPLDEHAVPMDLFSEDAMSRRARITAESVRREEEEFYYKTLDIMEVYYSVSCPVLYRDCSPLGFYFYLWVFIFQHERCRSGNYRGIGRRGRETQRNLQERKGEYHPVNTPHEFDILSAYPSFSPELGAGESTNTERTHGAARARSPSGDEQSSRPWDKKQRVAD